MRETARNKQQSKGRAFVCFSPVDRHNGNNIIMAAMITQNKTHTADVDVEATIMLKADTSDTGRQPYHMHTGWIQQAYAIRLYEICARFEIITLIAFSKNRCAKTAGERGLLFVSEYSEKLQEPHRAKYTPLNMWRRDDGTKEGFLFSKNRTAIIILYCHDTNGKKKNTGPRSTRPETRSFGSKGVRKILDWGQTYELILPSDSWRLRTHN